MPVTLNVVETETDLGIIVSQVVIESASEPGPSGVGVPAGGTTGQVLAKASDDDYDDEWVDQTGGGGGGVTDADYLVGTAHVGLSAEIVVGTSPGGELGGTWASPTVDASHSGSTHAAVQAAAEATAAAALSSHEADATNVHGITNTANLETTSGAQAKADAKVTQTIANGVTTTAPSEDAVFDALALKAALASPALTGSPTAPTQSAADNSTKIATTAYADAKVSDTAYAASWDAVTGIAPSKNAVYDQMELKAPLASPALTGNPTAPTQSAGNNSTRVATTAYADALVSDTAYDATSWNGVTGIAASKNAVRDKIEDILDGVTFTGDIVVPDEAYDATAWNGSLEVPTKNAVRDKIETMGGASPPTIVTAVGDGGGNHTTTSSSFADIHASLYDMSIPAAAGDVLVMRFECQWFHSGTGEQLRIKFTVAGTVSTGMPTNGLYVSAPGTSSNLNTFTWRHVVQSGEISGGNVAVVPQFATTASTLTVRNDGTNGKPLMTVENWRQ